MLKPLAFDVETTINSEIHEGQAKCPSNDFVTIISGDHPDRIEVVHNDEGFGRYCKGLSANRVYNEDILIVGHNLSFDLAYIIEYFKEHKRIPNCWDTSIAHFLMTGQRHIYPSLGELQDIYLGEITKEARIKTLYSKHIGADHIIKARHRCPRLFKLYNKYSYQDGSTVLKIFKKQYNLAQQRNMLNIIRTYNLFMAVLVIVCSNGIKIDETYIEKTIQLFKLEIIKLSDQIAELVVPYWNDVKLPKFNVASPTHVSALLFGGDIKCKNKQFKGYYKNGNEKWSIGEETVHIEGMQLDISYSKETKAIGKYSVDKYVVAEILAKETDPSIQKCCKLLAEIARFETMISTFLQPALKYAINGVLYPNFNNVAVITGRLSSSKPNLQNFPTKGANWQDIQRMFIAPLGYIIASLDYSQLEIYIAAWNSGDEALIRDIVNGLDFHCQSLAFATKKTYKEVYDLWHSGDKEWSIKRTNAKQITFKKEYGAGYKSVADATGLSEEEVKEAFDAIDEKYYKLKMFKDHVYGTAMKNIKLSNIKYLPALQKKGGKNGRKFNSNGIELLPINCGNNKQYDTNFLRGVGYYQTTYGKLYSFEEYAQLDKYGNIRRSISTTHTKNYPFQGGAADVMDAVSIEIMQYCLKYGVLYISQIHDSMIFYIKEQEKDLHIPRLCSIMENVPYALKKHLNVDMSLKFKVESKWGYNMAEMSIYEWY